ncbi:hypothetical protein [Lentzea cavernae]|uniref:DUF3558 domain-containing protein n=1 Tax=Lentzea cavernae TaxID=2020703 RepID=A0ABQ3MFA8_9PSEU|nr:hypothetical protein [Lentzea cavernae]GHH36449.1 hypothetical protein GCM10017774_23290 [Lentzea cavernae]
MDERKLADLFREAAHEAPPASFDAGDVRTASRKATLRRRNSIAAGTTLVVVLGLGGVVAANGWMSDNGTNTMNSAGSGQNRDDGAQSPMTALEAPPTVFSGKSESTQGDAQAPGSTGLTTGESTVQGCAGVDRELADALAVELSVSPSEAVPPDLSCSTDSRAAAFKIDGLTITAIVTPKPFEAPAGAEKLRTTAGQDLYVFTQGDGELKGQAKRFADALAPKF